MLACHEMVESSLGRRHDDEAHDFQDGTHIGLAHVLWSEYVVERTRRTLANELGWGFSDIENGFLVEQMGDLEAEIPQLVQWAVEHDEPPQRIFQLWFEMARSYAMALGRADAGCPADEDQVGRFRALTLVVQTSAGWDAVDNSLRGAFGRAGDLAAVLDESVYGDGWSVLYQQFTHDWNTRYEAALD